MFRSQVIEQGEEFERESPFVADPFQRGRRGRGRIVRGGRRIPSLAEDLNGYLKKLIEIEALENKRIKGQLIGRDVSHLLYKRNNRIRDAIEDTNNLVLRDLIREPVGTKIIEGLNNVINPRSRTVVGGNIVEAPAGYSLGNPSAFFTNVLGVTRENLNEFSANIQNQFEKGEEAPSEEAQRANFGLQNFINQFEDNLNRQFESERKRVEEQRLEFDTFGGALPTQEQGAPFTANSADDLLETTLIPAPPTPEQKPITPLTQSIPVRTPQRAMTPLTQSIPVPATPSRSPFERTTSISQGELQQAGLAQFGFGNITSIVMDDFALPPPTVGYDEHYHKQHSLVKAEELTGELPGERIFLREPRLMPLRQAQPASARTEQNQGTQPVPVPMPDPDEEPPKPIDPNPPNPDQDFPF
jgi:hypothetical protein